MPDEKKFFTSKLMKSFPTISLISLEALISEIQEIINKVSQALKLILGLTLMSALFLILATIQESFKQREKQNAILKTLGHDVNGIDLQFLVLIRGSTRFKDAWLHILGSLYNWSPVLWLRV